MTAAPTRCPPGPVPAAAPLARRGARPGCAREWQPPFPLDVRLPLSVHRRGGGDPAYAVDAAGAVWRTSLTPDGPGTLRVRSRPAAPPRSPLAGPAVGAAAVTRASGGTW